MLKVKVFLVLGPCIKTKIELEPEYLKVLEE